MKANFENAFKYKLIYVMRIEDEAHQGLVKIGDATIETDLPIDQLSSNCEELKKSALERIKNFTNTAGITTCLLHSEIAVRTVKQGNQCILAGFRDYDVHEILERSGFKSVRVGDSTGREWYRVDLETAKLAIAACKKNQASLGNTAVITKFKPIIFRPEQKDCINKVVRHFKRASRFLMNAKMRFGKTLVSLEIVKKSGFSKTIILTHRPVVNEGWYEDFKKIFFDCPDYLYGSKTRGEKLSSLLSSEKKFVYFASIQDLRGSTRVGGKFKKNSPIFDTIWDCVIVDEAHEGTTTVLGEDTVKAVVKENNKITKYLALSGTPFNIQNEFDNESTYVWDYVMEQERKAQWDSLHFGDSNPYEDLPELRIYTYSLEKIFSLGKDTLSIEDKAFNFREFFRTWTGDISQDYVGMPAGKRIGDFIHEGDVVSFLNLLTKESEDSFYPYSTEECRSIFRHSLWVVPGVREAKALKTLLLCHPVFGNGMFDIVNVAGDGDEEENSDDALAMVRNAIKSAGSDNYTITLSCGKLTTGVTVKEWTAVFMLAGSFSTSAANYLQTIFRVQSPCNSNGKIKDLSYVFDFAPDRTLKMVTKAVSVSAKPGKTNQGDKKILGKFLNYCPVISVTGSEMKRFSTEKLLQQLKKAYIERVVQNGFDDIHLYNDELLKLNEIDIKKFEDLKGLIGKTLPSKPVNDITVNAQGLTNEEYEELGKLEKRKKKERSAEEQKRWEELNKVRKLRNDAISILRGISVRMPLLLYGADFPYDEEISLDKFIEKVDLLSWTEFMPKGVTKDKFREFQKYYDEDVFIAAGRRIRTIVKEADELDPTERVKRISLLFATFKNPDKETVLTPWQVVNRHISDCLGGWDFWDENHNEMLEEPRFVSQGQKTEDIFSKLNARLLEINSKTGLYPLYLTYSLFQERCKKLTKNQLTKEKQIEIWNYVVENNVFVLCNTKMAKAITQRTLCGYSNTKINAHAYENLVNTLKNKPHVLVEKISRKAYWKKGEGDMKFDAIVGNPPYMAQLGGVASQPIYQYFVMQAKALSPRYISMITPSRWLTVTDGLLAKYTREMLRDTHISQFYDFSDARMCFPNVEIKGGVSYFLWDKQHDGPCRVTEIDGSGNLSVSERYLLEPGMDTFIRDSKKITILRKVISKKERSFSELVSPNDPYGFDTREDHSSKRRKISFEKEKKPGMIPLYYYGWRKDGVGYVKEKDLRKGSDLVSIYKFFIPKAWGVGDASKDRLNSFIPKPKAVCTETYLCVGPLKSAEEVKNALAYTKTKFFHLMVSILKSTQNTMQKVYQYVPLQEFSKSWTDADLYKKYKLTRNEISYIEQTVPSSISKDGEED